MKVFWLCMSSEGKEKELNETIQDPKKTHKARSRT